MRPTDVTLPSLSSIKKKIPEILQETNEWFITAAVKIGNALDHKIVRIIGGVKPFSHPHKLAENCEKISLKLAKIKQIA